MAGTWKELESGSESGQVLAVLVENGIRVWLIS